MASSLSKLWTAMTVSLVAATSVVCAATVNVNGNPNYVYDNSNCVPCCPARPCVDPCGNWFFDAEFLYLKTCQDGLPYASKTIEFTETDGATVRDTHVESTRFHWDAAFRLGLGYNFPCCGWDLSVYWTDLHTRAHNSTEKFAPNAVGETLTPAWGVFSGDDTISDIPSISKITCKHHIRLDILDVELGNEFCISSCFTLRPFIGARAVWIEQKREISSFAVSTSSAPVVTLVDVIRHKSEYRAVGLRTGFDSEWRMGCGFSLYGNAAASVVYGDYHNPYHELYPSGTFLYNQKHHFCACRFITDAAVGLRWKDCFTCGCSTVGVTISLGWEHHLFVNQNTFEDSNYSTTRTKNSQFTRGDLCLHGLNAGLRLDF